RPVLRSSLAAALLALTILDVSPMARSFFSPPMERAVFTDFLASQDYLKSSTVPGRIFAFSGRYFYLLTPYLSGRPLVSEAFNSYLQQRDMALLQGAAFLSDEYISAYLNIAGVSHLLIDKTDPDTNPAIRERFAGLLPTAFENANFLILENKTSTGEGFLARDFLRTADADPSVAGSALSGARYQLATIQILGASTSEPGLRGKIAGERIEAEEGKSLEEGRPFEGLKPQPGGSYQRVAFGPVTSDGWVVLNQAWHPDWRASSDAQILPIHRAFLGMSAVRTLAGKSVTFEFSPPWWYPCCAVLGLISWIAAVLLLLIAWFFPRLFTRPETTEPTEAIR
ncbi:MAG: hypothetical protein ACOYNN_10070, partial [Terrimicrobiaceae bacterium]